jgi:hypothetical protein
MDSSAQKIDSVVVTQLVGVVSRFDGAGASVRVDGSTYSASRAKSCLVAPEPGDRVLLAVTEKEAWILAVLEGTEEATSTTVKVDGELTIAADKVKLLAREEASIASSGRFEAVASRIDVRALTGNVAIHRLVASAANALFDVAELKTVATTVENVAERIVQKTKRLYRFVEELERVKAERMDVDAGKSLRMHAETSLVTAEKLVKVDGEHIHMG